jgi:Zinc-binding
MKHIEAKHPGITDPKQCFPTQLADYDPNDPDGEKAAEAAKQAAALKAKKAAEKKAAAGLDDLLDAGVAAGKKKGAK